MAKSKIAISTQIPKLGTAARKALLRVITDIPIYKQAREEGRRFLSKERLAEIEKDNTERGGISWEEIDKLMTREVFNLKKATFRKYLQDGLIPKAIKYSPTANGRIAIYDPTIISHLNLILFLFDVSSDSFLDIIIDVLVQNEITAFQAVESKLSEEDNLYAAVYKTHYQDMGDDIEVVISRALVNHPEIEKNAQTLFAEVKDALEQVDSKYEKLKEYLNRHTISLVDLPIS